MDPCRSAWSGLHDWPLIQACLAHGQALDLPLNVVRPGIPCG